MRGLLFGLLSLFVYSMFAQNYEDLIKSERDAFWVKSETKKKRSGQAYDIVYHNIKLNIDPAVRQISGSVTSKLIALETNFTRFSFDLENAMTVDSILWEGAKLSFSHSNEEVQIDITSQPINTEIDIEIFYHGDPTINDQKAFSYDFQKDGPIAWTLSQPYGAYGWWPCKQQLADKIDSLDLEITIPKGNKAAGNGILIRVDTLPNEDLVFHWKHRYPIATYLVAVAVTNYYEESHYIKLSNGDSVFHIDYLYPAYKPAADTLRWAIDGQMRLFDSLFGTYPFINEKHGHAQFARGGGMEHQTMSFMSDLGFDLMAHELAHQWFGDKITCGSWRDLWLNEGFATYINGLAREFLLSREYFTAFLTTSRDRAISQPDGSVYAYDTTNVAELFSGNIRYRKGAMVLHMLRWAVGDSAFFTGMRNYAEDPELCYDFSNTADFKYYMEQSSGMDLTNFFDVWVYEEGFPSLVTRWKRQSSSVIEVQINQSTSHSSVSFFPLKAPYLAKGENRDTMLFINHSSPAQLETIDVGFEVQELVFDPEVWLLAQHTMLEGDHTNLQNISVYPNPVDEEISIYIKDLKINRLEVMDLLGHLVLTKEVQELKNVVSYLDVTSLTNGIYFLKVYSDEDTVLLKFVKTSE
jgi:aminopeptidase N